MKTLLAVALCGASMGVIASAAEAQCGCQPTVAYYAPAATTAYYAPTTTYYSAPVTTYYAPTTAYYAPATAYYPTTAYYAPTAAYYPTTAYYGGGYVGRPGIFGWRYRRAYRRGNIMTTQGY